MVELKTGADPLYQEALLFDMNWFGWRWPWVFLLWDLFICALTTVHPMGWLALDLMHKPHVFMQSFLTYHVQGKLSHFGIWSVPFHCLQSCCSTFSFSMIPSSLIGKKREEMRQVCWQLQRGFN